jgi:hypothetical protein
MTYFYLYKITNLVNGKIYVGVHKTKSLDDGYMGSGKIIRSAVQKHGISNFSKDILEFFDTSEAMYAKEKEIVTEEFLEREDTYNLRRGGNGGFDWINKEGLNYKGFDSALERNRFISPFGKEGYNWIKELSKKSITQEVIEKRVKSFIDNGGSKRASLAMLIACNSETVREKRKHTFDKINHQQGAKNSQSGTIWITNGIENKKINKNSLIPEGWNKGRTLILECFSNDTPPNRYQKILAD